MRFAEVAVDAPTGPSRTFSYSIPDGRPLSPGQLVLVPFGPRTIQGVVFELTDAPSVEETREISENLFDDAVVNETQLALAHWISDYYRCSLFEAVAPMLPPGSRVQTRTVVSIAEHITDIESASNSPRQLRVLEAVRRDGQVDVDSLEASLGDWARATVGPLVSRGVLERTYRSSRRMIGPRYLEFLRVRTGALGEIKKWLSESGSRAPRQAELILKLVESNSLVAAAQMRREFGPSVVSGLRDKGFIQIEQTQVFRDPLADREYQPGQSVELSQPQQNSVDAIAGALADTAVEPRVVLVQGVTGSGKTEVYLSAVEQCLAHGRQAIVLVPEIALTGQTIERFAGRFPGRVAVQHSGLTGGQRHDQWWAIHNGSRDVVIGSRGAVFAPVSNPGLIVLDEEHEWTYKQHDMAPKYHARSVAEHLGRLTGAVTVLGSASPDVGSYYLGRRHEYDLRVLKDRLVREPDGSTSVLPLPQVEVVDMRQELRDGNRGMFSRRLHSELASCLESGQQAILFLNRRGTASHMQCRHCGQTLTCGGCNVALTYHRPIQRLICHYCGRRRRMPESCPECLSFRLSLYGIGTQAVAAEVEREFPQARVLRWDRDATRHARAYEDLLAKFRSGEADVIVGTQMIAKGLHLPGVTVVGVVLADVGLGIPDYRSGERTFQLLCQVAGRSGREHDAGRVVFQTYQPENYAIRAAAAQDYELFYIAEMRYRREQRNPPYSRLIRLVYGHTNAAMAESRANELAKTLRQTQSEADLGDVEILGPTPPYPSRLRGRYRWHIVLRGQNPRALLDLVEVPREWSVDVDPVALT